VGLGEEGDASGLAGVSSLLSTLREQILTSVMSHSLSSRSVSASTSNILLHGPSGVGKTSILHTLASSLQASLNTTLYVDCTSLVEQRISQLKSTFQEWKDALDWYAHSNSGAILMLDNLDKVLIGEVENVDPTRARTMAECFVQVFSQNGTGNAIVLGTALSNTSLHKLLVEKHFWNETLSVKPPGKGERSDVSTRLPI
jgi:peroxin-1